MDNIDKKYMELAIKVGQKSNCSREDRQVGAVIVKKGKILGEGFNFIPEKLGGVCDKCCYRKKNNIASGTCIEKCFSICAEQHAIKNALQGGADLTGATVYTSLSPCALCARWIVFVGIARVVYLDKYHDMFSKNILKKAGVQVDSIKL